MTVEQRQAVDCCQSAFRDASSPIALDVDCVQVGKSNSGESESRLQSHTAVDSKVSQTHKRPHTINISDQGGVEPPQFASAK